MSSRHGRSRKFGVTSSLLGFFLGLAAAPLPAQIRDGGIDPWNLGKGEWVYILRDATNHLGGRVPAVTNLPSLMIFLKNQGLTHLIIKAGSGHWLYPSGANPQFTPEVVSAAHAAGLWLFGYNYSYGTNVPGEIAIADYVFNCGADGFVFDAEIEWETLPNRTMVATQLCSAVRANWPTKFLAHAPFPYISFHTAFPYKEFGYYCDAVMPQDYWIEIGVSPSACARRMNSDWTTWQNGLTGIWTNAIKPLVPVGQGWTSADGAITAAQITEFFTALKTNASPATRGGFKGANFWRAELHPPEVWDAIRTNSIGNAPTNAPWLGNIGVSALTDTAATITWTTDQSSDSVVEYGLTSGYGHAFTGAAPTFFHAVTLTGLERDATYHFRVKSGTALDKTSVSTDHTFTTPAAAAADIIVDEASTGFASTGTWYPSSSGYNGSYLWASTGTTEGRTATFRPTILTPGAYDVYVTFIQGSNRATDAPWTVSSSGGTTNVTVNQNGPAGVHSGWVLLAGARSFAAGTNGTVRLSNHTGETGWVVIADAVKLVFVPPPPSSPRILAQPVSLIVTQGRSATFTVSAAGTALLAYQWRFNGTDLAGETGSGFIRAAVQSADAGGYTVVITNAFGAVTSAPAMLAVTPPSPARFEPPVLVGGTSLWLRFVGEPGATYALELSTNLTSWLLLFDFTNPPSGAFEFIDLAPADASPRFYRTRQ
ncbi:MAG: fibronectin type III domain-containing protein [Verrucomicrobia bacterium]|nr:fibronectin type III domain-containing protein [Verrucomicrobiota bacterium]